jgi:branched-chain amino acid transport system substrate-binding protein
MSLINRPARVGLITDQTGALSFMGIANVNVAKMVTDDINARGGLLGRPIELFVEARPTTTSRTQRPPDCPGADVDMVVGASTAQPGRRSSARWSTTPGALPLRSSTKVRRPSRSSAPVRHPLSSRAVHPWLMQETGARTLHLPRPLHLAAC